MMCNKLAVLEIKCNEFFVSVHPSDQCSLLEVNESAASFHTSGAHKGKVELSHINLYQITQLQCTTNTI